MTAGAHYLKFKIPLAEPLIGEDEEKEVVKVIRSGWLREGKTVRRFEEEFAKYVGVKHAISTSSGTAALHVALSSISIKRDDEVILPSFSCVPPVSMTLLLGGIPVFADIEPVTYNIDTQSVRKMITRRTKAIIPINYAGHPAELDTIGEICEDYCVCMLNDAAEALGALYKGKEISAYGDLSVFSFSPNKTITTGEGGMVTTNNGEIAEKARIIKDYGQTERFHYVELGHNYHMTEMQAAIGLAQLRKIDQILQLKRKNAKLLSEELSKAKDIATPVEKPNCLHAYTLYSIRVLSSKVSRDELIKRLENAGIQTRIYFPPVHRSPMMKKFCYKADRLEETEKVAGTILSLPISAKLSTSEINYICALVTRIYK